MSAQRFCHHCGKEVRVGSKFCSECGTNLLSLSSTPSPAPRETFTPFIAKGDDDEDGDSYIDRMSHLNIQQDKLHVEIVKHGQARETVGGALQQAAVLGAGDESFKRSQPFGNVDAKALEAEFRREAGAIKPQETRHVLKDEK